MEVLPHCVQPASCIDGPTVYWVKHEYDCPLVHSCASLLEGICALYTGCSEWAMGKSSSKRE